MDGGAVSCPCADCLSGRARRQPPNPTMSDIYVMQLHRDHATAAREDRAPEPGPAREEPADSQAQAQVDYTIKQACICTLNQSEASSRADPSESRRI